MSTAVSTARLEARISSDLHSMLKRAAEIQGRTMTDFVVSAVQDSAHFYSSVRRSTLLGTGFRRCDDLTLVGIHVSD